MRSANKNGILLREDEIDRLFTVIDSVRDRAIFRVACNAALRASEVGKLDIEDRRRAKRVINSSGQLRRD